jgi:glutamate synthase (NADPH/NADH) large chain
MPLDSADVEILTDLLEKHVAETDSTLAPRCSPTSRRPWPLREGAAARLRGGAQDAPGGGRRGLDPDGDVVWTGSWR